MPHSFFIEMLTLYILSSPMFRPTSIFFFNIFVMVTQYSILLMSYNVSIHHPLRGTHGLLSMFSFKQCSLSILRAKSLNTAFISWLEVTSRSRLTESKDQQHIVCWVTGDLVGKRALWIISVCISLTLLWLNFPSLFLLPLLWVQLLPDFQDRQILLSTGHP